MIDIVWPLIFLLMICVLCNKEFDEYEKVDMGEHSFVAVGGHNPAPLSKEGRCCSKCNYSKVLPARLQNMYKTQPNERSNTKT